MKKAKALRLEIDIRQQNINQGVQEDAETCAIAHRLGQMELENPVVDEENIEFDYQGQHYVASTPARAATFIEKFDGAKVDVKPFTFNIVAKPDYDNDMA